jgi:hypothetical protein
MAVFAVAGCIGGETVADVTPSAVAPSVQASSPSPSSAPPSVVPSSPPAEASPSTPALTSSPSETPVGEGSAADCTGTDDNRSFYAAAAKDLDWPVYCPVLPDRWFVTEGTYRTAGIGWLQISYRGPGGAGLALHQGAFCDDGDGCVAAGTGSGDSPFGDQTGMLIVLDGGGYAIVVDRGQMPSWLIVGTGLDEARFRDIAAELVRLD